MRAPAILLLVAALAIACRDQAGEVSTPRARPSPSPLTTGSPLGDGFIVWESNRSGRFRIWTQRLDGSGLRQLSPDEADRHHAAPHISPDGTRVAYVSLDYPWNRYPEETIGVLHLVAIDGGADRVLAERARTYFEDRAVTWIDDRSIAYIDGEGYTVRLDLDSKSLVRLTRDANPQRPWLPDPTLRWMTSGEATFSPFDAATGVVARQRLLGGCQPWFSSDGRWGYWANGAGGPISRMELETRAISTILKKHDPRLPEDLGYVYFPMVSRDQSLLALAASNDLHDHFRYDYEILVAPIDPATLALVGDFVRLTEHPAIDRFPDVWAAPTEPGRSRVTAASVARPTPQPVRETADATRAWPVSRAGLVFLWDTGNAPNLVQERGVAAPLTYALEEQGASTLDHDYALTLHGGLRFVGGEPTKTFANAFKRTNEITIEATIRPAVASTTVFHNILGMSSGRTTRNFTLGQLGEELLLRLRTSDTPVNGADVSLGRITSERPHHVVVSYAPGLLQAWIDGERSVTSDFIQGDFFHWVARVLVIGAEATGEAPWRGTIRGVALYDRVFDDAEAAESHRRYRAILDASPAVASVTVRARLRAASTFPSPQDISPYRRALAVLEWEVTDVHSGTLADKVIRVAHWSMLDSRPTAITEFKPGALSELRVERFADNPQVASDYLSDTLAMDDGELWLDVGDASNRR